MKAMKQTMKAVAQTAVVIAIVNPILSFKTTLSCQRFFPRQDSRTLFFGYRNRGTSNVRFSLSALLPRSSLMPDPGYIIVKPIVVYNDPLIPATAINILDITGANGYEPCRQTAKKCNLHLPKKGCKDATDR